MPVPAPGSRLCNLREEAGPEPTVVVEISSPTSAIITEPKSQIPATGAWISFSGQNVGEG